MDLFFTIIAWAFLVIAIIRMVGIYFGAQDRKAQLHLARMVGQTPVLDAVRVPLLTIVMCVAWIISGMLV